MGKNSEGTGFSSVKERLDQIAEAVGDESLPLDAALDLFEEAVALGLQVGDLLEDGVEADAAAQMEAEAAIQADAKPDGADGAPASDAADDDRAEAGASRDQGGSEAGQGTA